MRSLFRAVCTLLLAAPVPLAAGTPTSGTPAAGTPAAGTPAAGTPAAGTRTCEVVVIRLDGAVHQAAQRFVERGLQEAEQRRAALVVLELDTPGGLVENTRDILSAITSSPVPVAVYVSPAGARASSAGFFILLAADVAAMAPGTNTGASHPVLVPIIPVGDGEIPEEMTSKAVSDTAAMVRSLAQDRHRNEEAAVRAVTEIESFSAREALDKGLIDRIATSRQDLLQQLDGTEVTRIDGSHQLLELGQYREHLIELSAREELQTFLSTPLVAFLLMVVAGLGIYTEITHPGGIFPGVVGIIALVLFLYTSSVLPVNWVGVALILVAMVLFILEVKVTSYGLLTLTGICSFVAGSLMLFDAPIPEMRLSLGTVLPAAILLAAVMIFLLLRVLKAHQQQTLTGREGLVGETGVALSALAPRGKVLVYGEYWDARCMTGEVASGTPVEVVAVAGRLLEVVPVADAADRHQRESTEAEQTDGR